MISKYDKLSVMISGSNVNSAGKILQYNLIQYENSKSRLKNTALYLINKTTSLQIHVYNHFQRFLGTPLDI